MDSIGLDGGERWTLHFLVGRRWFTGNHCSHDADRSLNFETGRDCVESRALASYLSSQALCLPQVVSH